MDSTPKTSEMIDVTIDGNDADIDVPEPRSKSRSKSKSKVSKGRKQASVAELKENIATPKQEETAVEFTELEPEPQPKIEDNTINEVKTEPKTDETVIADPKIEEGTVAQSNEDKKDSELVSLFKKYLCDSSLTKEVSIKLDDKVTECFMFILETYPDDLDGFNKLIQIVLDDSRIDIEDLPEAVKICSKMYLLVTKSNIRMDYNTAIECTRLILKFSIRVLLFEKKIKIEYEHLVGFLKGFDELVDVCLDMLIESKAVEKGCSTFFKKLMCKSKKK